MKGKRIEKVLVTGGIGFIGSHVVDLLLKKNYQVRILDNLEMQVHGRERKIPEYFNEAAELIIGDVCDRKTVYNVLKDIDAVIHLAAAVGVGQSMYQIEKYVSCNTAGTANFLDIIVNENNNIRKLIVASSMSIYGEGKYLCDNCGSVYPNLRSEKQLKHREWELKCPNCGKTIKPLPTDEDKPLMPTSVYAQTKRHQEELCLLIGKTYKIPTVALRYFNVYGPRQTLNNPYTGVCALFSNRILNKKPPYIFEDGMQVRDFVNVKDVARASVLALERSGADYLPVNVGSGEPISILRIAESLIELYGIDLKPYISLNYRKMDVRHCFADITRAYKLLGYKPSKSLKENLKELVSWALANNWGTADLFDKALKELEEKKLIAS